MITGLLGDMPCTLGNMYTGIAGDMPCGHMQTGCTDNILMGALIK